MRLTVSQGVGSVTDQPLLCIATGESAALGVAIMAWSCFSLAVHL